MERYAGGEVDMIDRVWIQPSGFVCPVKDAVPGAVGVPSISQSVSREREADVPDAGGTKLTATARRGK